MKANIPKLKKKMSNYLLSEEGKISKQSLLAMGTFLGGAAIGLSLSAEEISAGTSHGNDLSISYDSEVAYSTHAHHASHSSHSSHSSY